MPRLPLLSSALIYSGPDCQLLASSIGPEQLLHNDSLAPGVDSLAFKQDLDMVFAYYWPSLLDLVTEVSQGQRKGVLLAFARIATDVRSVRIRQCSTQPLKHESQLD